MTNRSTDMRNLLDQIKLTESKVKEAEEYAGRGTAAQEFEKWAKNKPSALDRFGPTAKPNHGPNITVTITAGAMLRRTVRRVLDQYAQQYNFTYKEDKGLLDSQFAITGPRDAVTRLAKGINDAYHSTIGEAVEEEGELDERAPHNPKAERFIKGHKAEFKKRYGKAHGENVLYATAWKKFGESAEECEESDDDEDKHLAEGIGSKFAKAALAAAAAGAIGVPMAQIAKQGYDYHRAQARNPEISSMHDAEEENLYHDTMKNESVESDEGEELEEADGQGDMFGGDVLDRDVPRAENFTGPSVWASYLINGDDSGLDAEEKAAADKWLEGIHPYHVVGAEGEPRFTWSYDLYGGLAKGGDVIDYQCLKDGPHASDEALDEELGVDSAELAKIKEALGGKHDWLDEEGHHTLDLSGARRDISKCLEKIGYHFGGPAGGQFYVFQNGHNVVLVDKAGAYLSYQRQA